MHVLRVMSDIGEMTECVLRVDDDDVMSDKDDRVHLNVCGG